MNLAKKYNRSLRDKWCLQVKTDHPDGDKVSPRSQTPFGNAGTGETVFRRQPVTSIRQLWEGGTKQSF
jgi:hypothetical protein